MNARDWFSRQLRNLTGPEAIVHLGAGRCRELPAYLRSGPGRIFLVEPNPEVLIDLRKKASGIKNVDVVPAAVSSQSGRRALRLLNFPALSSLRRPTGLMELFPGLREIGQAMVETVGIMDLLEQFDIRESGSNWLVVDTPGEEALVLQDLREKKGLHLFSRIFLRAGRGSFYEGSADAESILGSLQTERYRQVGTQDDTDPDWPCYQLVFDRQSAENKKLRKELDRLRTETHSIKNDLSMALRLQTLREADLRELQERYADVVDVKKRQDELLAKLRQRLGVASDYLKQISAYGEENLTEVLARDLVKALVGEAERES